jgi:hypothetical protein
MRFAQGQFRDRVGSAFLLAVTLAGTAALGISSPVLTSVTSGATLIALGTLLVASIPIVKRLANPGLDVFEPIVPAAITLAILFAVRPLWTAGKESSEFQSPFHTYEIGSTYIEALFLGFLGTICFVVAYEASRVGPRESKRVERSLFHPGVVRAYGLALVVLAVTLFALYLSTAGSVSHGFRLFAAGRSAAQSAAFNSPSEYLSAAPILAACAAITFVVIFARALSRTQAIVLIACASFPVFVFSLVGNRRFIIPSILVPLVSYYLALDKRPAGRRILVVAVISFLVIATIPYARTSGAREQAGGAVPIFVSAVTSPARTVDRFLAGSDTEMISALAVELAVLNNASEYSYGKATLGDLLLAPIPSAVFPGKPRTARDDLLVDAFGHPCAPQRGGCPDFSVVGTFFQDFWYLGVCVGMGLLGVTAARLWSRYEESKSDPYRVLAAATTVVFLPIIIRAGFMPAFAWSLYYYVPALVGLHLASVRR